MKVIEIQHTNKTRDLIIISNIEGISQRKTVEQVEYAGEHHEKIDETFYIHTKSSNYMVQSSDKIFSLSDSHVTGQWEIKRDEISFDEFYTAVAIALIQRN